MLASIALLAALLSVSLVRASPAPLSPGSSGCHRVGVLPYNFTLSALNTTLPDSNTTGVPLVLGEAGATDGAEFEIISTYASYPYDDFPLLSLMHHAMIAWDREDESITNATSIFPGSSVSFYTSALGGVPPVHAFGAKVCADQEYALLAAHGHIDLWALCPGNEGPLSQNTLIYNVTAAIGQPYLSFDPSDCYAVAVNIIPS